jgi:hypothetical protein
MGKLADSILSEYFKTYEELVVAEETDGQGVTLSFPLHFSGNHRVELTVTQLSAGDYIVSDQARTLMELRDAGYRITADIKEKLEEVARLSGLRVVQDHLVLKTKKQTLGADIQRFLEATKTIADVYLVHKVRPVGEKDLLAEVKKIFDARSLKYDEKAKLRGEIEDHPFDLVVPPNGHAGIAVHILSGQSTHTLAQVWGFKCDDIRRERQNDNMRLGLIYDVRNAVWSETSRMILGKRADIAMPGSALADLPRKLAATDVLKE